MEMMAVDIKCALCCRAVLDLRTEIGGKKSDIHEASNICQSVSDISRQSCLSFNAELDTHTDTHTHTHTHTHTGAWHTHTHSFTLPFTSNLHLLLCLISTSHLLCIYFPNIFIFLHILFLIQ